MGGIRDLMSLPQVKAAEDYGFFGPGSVTWKVWSYPTSLTVGFQRSVVIEELDPALVAAVDKTHEIYKRPRTRYDRTLRYFSMVAFGDSASTVKAADVLVKIHSKAVGTDEVTGIRYDANDPASQLWIHLTAWHSILVAYEKYGPGKLSPEEEKQYWAECALAAELQTCDPADVPTTREGIRQYFDEMRPQLLGSDIAKKAMNHLLRAEVMLPPMPPLMRPGALLITAFPAARDAGHDAQVDAADVRSASQSRARRGSGPRAACRVQDDRHEHPIPVDAVAATLAHHRRDRRARAVLGSGTKSGDHHAA
jgi:uncharacterized protein (DUF2236 family)